MSALSPTNKHVRNILFIGAIIWVSLMIYLNSAQLGLHSLIPEFLDIYYDNLSLSLESIIGIDIFGLTLLNFVSILQITSTIAVYVAYRKQISAIETYFLFTLMITPKLSHSTPMVRDQTSNSAISFAVLRLFREREQHGPQLVNQVITEFNGEYQLSAPQESEDYYLEVEAEGYKPKMIKLRNTEPGEAIKAEIYLQRISGTEDLRDEFHRVLEFLRSHVLLFLLFASGLNLYRILYAAFSDLNFLSGSGVLLLGYIFIYNAITMYGTTDRKGKVLDISTKDPIPGLGIKVFEGGKEIADYLTNRDGEIHTDLPKGSYSAEIASRGYTFNGHRVLEININKRGELANNILISKAESKTQGINPFSREL